MAGNSDVGGLQFEQCCSMHLLVIVCFSIACSPQAAELAMKFLPQSAKEIVSIVAERLAAIQLNEEVLYVVCEYRNFFYLHSCSVSFSPGAQRACAMRHY